MAGRIRNLIQTFPSIVFLLGASLSSEANVFPHEDSVFRVYGERPFRDLHFSSANGLPQSLKFYSNSRSTKYEYAGPRTLTFYRLPDDFSESDYLELIRLSDVPVLYPPNAEIVATVDWNESLTEPLFIFFRNSAQGDGNQEFLIYPFNDSLNAFPWQTLVVFNASRMPIGGRVGSETHNFPPGPTGPFRVSRSINLSLATRRADGIRSVLEGPMEVSSDERLFMLLLPPVLSGSTEVQYRLVRQLRDEDPEELQRLEE